MYGMNNIKFKNTQWIFASSTTFYSKQLFTQKREQWPTFPYIHPGSFRHLLQRVDWMNAFSTKFWHCEKNHCETASCTSASPRCFFRGPKRWKSLDPTQPDRWQPCCSNLDGSVSCIHCTACLGTNFSVLWTSIFLVTDSKMVQQCKKLSYSDSIHKVQKAYIQW